jgi:hypothetical protein
MVGRKWPPPPSFCRPSVEKRRRTPMWCVIVCDHVCRHPRGGLWWGAPRRTVPPHGAHTHRARRMCAEISLSKKERMGRWGASSLLRISEREEKRRPTFPLSPPLSCTVKQRRGEGEGSLPRPAAIAPRRETGGGGEQGVSPPHRRRLAVVVVSPGRRDEGGEGSTSRRPLLLLPPDCGTFASLDVALPLLLAADVRISR